MFVLGINAYHADSSAAIFKDGVMIAATEEERFRRVKHWAGFPSIAVDFCLKEAGITLQEVDYVAIGRDVNAKKWKKLAFVAKHPFSSFHFVKNRFFNQKKVASIEEELNVLSGINTAILKPKIHNIEHHRSHMASAFYASPYEEAAILSIDGSGDFSTTMIGIGRGNKIEVLDSVDFPHSLGIFYTAFTQLLGFPHYGDEYKIMGLAPYGKPLYVDRLKKIIKLTGNGLFQLNLSYFRSPSKGFVGYGENNLPVIPSLFGSKMIAEFGAARTKEEELTQYHKDLAASVQRVTEETIFYMLNALQKRTGLTKVCIAGGVAQNSVANGKITRNTSFKEVYIPSAGHDAGISMGSALYVYHQVFNKARTKPVYSAYTGARFSNETIEQLLMEKNIQYKKLNDDLLFDYVADRLINAGVVGWFNGRAEFGPRALGARSILADPRRTDAKDLLNTKIKRRESFRPFAPSILKEYVDEYFEVNDVVPFMEKVFPVKKEKHAIIPAVTHADGTGRLQTVDKEVSPRYYQLIATFGRKSGVPILLNTSFNENEPIVNSPEEALNCFLRTNMDMLVMENIIVER
ncbi:MAG: carbamoyltransferase [Chitinophaga sp.]|jgi:carbamoyltransferase|nr:carbamoyltransferase [Chitinophaga sp.]